MPDRDDARSIGLETVAEQADDSASPGEDSIANTNNAELADRYAEKLRARHKWQLAQGNCLKRAKDAVRASKSFPGKA